MEEKNKKEKVEEVTSKKESNTSKLLNIFLSIIVLVTVITRNYNLLFNI